MDYKKLGKGGKPPKIEDHQMKPQRWNVSDARTNSAFDQVADKGGTVDDYVKKGVKLSRTRMRDSTPGRKSKY